MMTFASFQSSMDGVLRWGLQWATCGLVFILLLYDSIIQSFLCNCDVFLLDQITCILSPSSAVNRVNP
jgi:hypothetical protein